MSRFVNSKLEKLIQRDFYKLRIFFSDINVFFCPLLHYFLENH